MRYVTIAMIAAHAKKDRSSVLRALKLAKITPEKITGALGYRIKERDANTFLARQWPSAGPMPLPAPPVPLRYDI
jgi:hypothetical protein